MYPPQPASDSLDAFGWSPENLPVSLSPPGQLCSRPHDAETQRGESLVGFGLVL